jgi:hypothetical protein
MEIKKKIWPNSFQRILNGKKTADLRLADFDIHEGDILILEEYDPKTKQYTGRTIRKKVKNLNKIKLTDYHSIEDITKYGNWIIELE